MGFVDRGGGREAKGSSLRRSKKNPGAAAARGKAEPKTTAASASPVSLPPPLPRLVVGSDGSVKQGASVDCSVAYLSRKFEADRERICDRSASEGKCGAIIAWCSEVERQEALLSACADRPGQLYCIIGVHPDNIDRTNKKSQEMWLEQVERLGKSAECVALLTGLNMMREAATHFAQEALFKSLYALAARVKLPLVVHTNPDDASIEATLSFLQGCREEPAEGQDAGGDDEHAAMPAPNRIVLQNVGLLFTKASPAVAKLLVESILANRLMCTVSTAGLDFDPSTGLIPLSAALGEYLLALAAERLLLLSSDSPWNTPQNITDEYLRTLHNEPANLPFVRQWIVNYMRACSATPIDDATLEQAWAEDAIATFFSSTAEDDDVDVDSDAANDKKNDNSEQNLPSNQHAATAPAAVALPTTVEVPGQHMTEAETGPQAVPIPNAKPDAFLSCVKCRARLFPQTMLVTHPTNAKRITFQGKGGKAGGGGGGSCEATLFISLCGAEDDEQSGSSVSFPSSVRMDCAGDSALCGGCKCKLGSIAFEAPCPCGCLVPGNTARLVASRVEVIDTTASVAAILSRAAQEAELQQQEQDDEDSDDDDGGKKRQKKQKVNVKASNRSNFTNYRNKTFAGSPSAAVSAPAQGDDSQPAGKKKNKKGKRGGGSDSD